MTASTDSTLQPVKNVRVFRIEVSPKPGEVDPLGLGVLRETQSLLPGITAVQTARIYLIAAPLDDASVGRIASELLADPINQTALLGASPVSNEHVTVEVHYQPGVMDPVAQSTRDAIGEMLSSQLASLGGVDNIEVRTGFRFDLIPAPGVAPKAEDVERFAQRALANTVIQNIHLTPYHPEKFEHGRLVPFNLTHVTLRPLEDDALNAMSRSAHLFLSLDEMRAVRDYFRAEGREPTDIELETVAQTWSEHCVHKTLKSTIRYVESGGNTLNIADKTGHTANADGSITIKNLLKSTVAAATKKLMHDDENFRAWCVSVFEDNSGIVKFDDEHGVCIKVETHNHPSAIEPYGGAATGIGGCIRDIMGTGLVSKPIANTDTFCVAPPDTKTLPKGVIHPRRVLQQVVAGVRDYGNRMGIPTVNGSVYFHPDFLGNPLVFAGCIGIIPLDKCFGNPRPGDRIIALGGRTGRDGIHGATFSSAELTDSHADEFAHAVQIGNAITQKQVLDVLLQAQFPVNDDGSIGAPLYNAITDCGAGGFSSAVGEMGKNIGARVTLESAPLKYPGLTYTEIWISEAQERMVLAVPPEKVAALQKLCDAENVELCDLGVFGIGLSDKPELVLTFNGTEVGRVSMHLLHEGVPTPTREATWTRSESGVPAPEHRTQNAAPSKSISQNLHALLAHPNIASKHWIIRQYDHEVQGGSVVKPLCGPDQQGPSDASVLRPKLNSDRGIALGCGLAPFLSEKTPGGDSYWATLAAMDEAIRNVTCVGANLDPTVGGIAILDNFCWPRCEDPKQLGSLVRAAEACYDGALAYRTPFVSGKDSLSNQFTTEDGKLITIPPTMLISALGIVPDVMKARTMDAKAAGNALLIVGTTTTAMGGSHYLHVSGDGTLNLHIPKVDLKAGPANAKAVSELISQGLVASAHDCSEGGLLVAAAEMAFAGKLGLDLNLDGVHSEKELDDVTACFAETPSRYLLEIPVASLDRVVRLLREAHVPFGQIGLFASHDKLTVRCKKHGRLMEESLAGLLATWRKSLDW